jgi:hypothetical protein
MTHISAASKVNLHFMFRLTTFLKLCFYHLRVVNLRSTCDSRRLKPNMFFCGFVDEGFSGL